jgi:formamidopyrimidine-DNA glycosylase
MPELPEVETVLRGLKARVLGRRVTSVEVLHPMAIVGSGEEFARAVTGRSIEAVERKGKALAIRLTGQNGEDPLYLLIRLGMTGQFTLAARNAELEPHTHARLALEDGGQELRYRDPRRFGRLRSLTRQQLDAVFARMGPDARNITEEQFNAALKGRRGAIKGWLMNQAALSGLGNIYADEALFAAGIHPLAQAGRLSPEAARRLCKSVKKILDRAVELQGTSFRDYIDIEGRPGGFLPRLKVYQRDGKPCRRCRRPLRRVVIAGRSSHFCPHCQPRPRRVATMRGPRR